MNNQIFFYLIFTAMLVLVFLFWIIYRVGFHRGYMKAYIETDQEMDRVLKEKWNEICQNEGFKNE